MTTLADSRDVMPPPGWQPKSPFFKALWAKIGADLLESWKVPVRGRMTCPHCSKSFAVSLHMDDPIE